MLYSSPIYIFIFLPVVITGFYLISDRFGNRIALFWLLIASFFFYGYWTPEYLLLLFFSIIFNLLVGRWLSVHPSKNLLICGLVVNLGTLGVFKYTNFCISILNQFGFNFALFTVELPIGISFFTFQQIAFLVESYRNPIDLDYDPLRYSLFVSLFCQLISGPIVRQQELVPQFKQREFFQLNYTNISSGIFLFSLGAAKKVFADFFVDWSYLPSSSGLGITFTGAWLTSLCYAMRIYFDFSAYIDMARGAAKMLNIDIPINFDTPYLAQDFRDFWRRWNITLSSFLRDYLYIPLGGNRKSTIRVGLNLFLTMLLAGVWHGAGWPFIIWGSLHGLFLIFNHITNHLKVKLRGFWGRIITFTGVTFAWSFFKSETANEGFLIAKTMLGLNGIGIPVPGIIYRLLEESKWLKWFGEQGIVFDPFTHIKGYYGVEQVIYLFVALILSMSGPNSNELSHSFQPTVSKAVLAITLFVFSILYLADVKDFVYFQF